MTALLRLSGFHRQQTPPKDACAQMAAQKIVAALRLRVLCVGEVTRPKRRNKELALDPGAGLRVCTPKSPITILHRLQAATGIRVRREGLTAPV